MNTTTLGLKVDPVFRTRLKAVAESAGKTPHGFIKQAVLDAIEAWERKEVSTHLIPGGHSANPVGLVGDPIQVQPFLDFAQSVGVQSVYRAAITAATRRPEPQCLPLLVDLARLHPEQAQAAQTMARGLIEALRAKRSGGGVEGLLQEFSLSSQEGVALMCLAEALLRIPDRATRDALIRDKIGKGDWQSHVGQSPSLFVNAAAWGLMLTGKLIATNSEQGLSAALTRLIGKGGEPLVRSAVDRAMRLMGEQFVTGETIGSALARSRSLEARGFRYSYDMLGEAATTAADSQRYCDHYEQAIHAIGKASAGRGIYEGPGISIKLSALHPRYCRAQRERVMQELLPRLRALCLLAHRYDIGINIDAEEADRLELSLDLLEALCFDEAFSGWNGIGFVVQAYQKRAPFVIDHLIDLAHRSRRRIMVRLVKGAYWDTEIKRTQIDGLEGYPVFTRKVHTDVSYLACARKLLSAPQAIYPQFATHNAHTVASIVQMGGANYYAGQYEFQCLHGMGEPLYEEVISQRPCRIYAPVGTHETLLAYLVRRLLENGANTSFVNQIADPSVAVEMLIEDPVEAATRIQPLGAPHPRIALARDLYLDPEGQGRANAQGLDLCNEQRLASLAPALLASAQKPWRAAPPQSAWDQARAQPVCNPADRRDVIGEVVNANPDEVDQAIARALAALPIWQSTPAIERARCLEQSADRLEAQLPYFLGLLVREAGKTLPNAVAEVREAVDFLRYYAMQARTELERHPHTPLGVVACISPWNFPLAIFIGQAAAALAAGNTVVAKPAEQTPLSAAAIVDLLHRCGMPQDALQLLPGGGETVGAQLVADHRVAGVMFTGSTQVARRIASTLAKRLDARGHVIPLIAETGGQNAMIVDSSALPEQVVQDVLASAFDSAGQRCSALRLLCLQEEIAESVLTMLRGAMQELHVGHPDRLECDVGPVIDADAANAIETHISSMQTAGHRIERQAIASTLQHGNFVAPTLIEIDHPGQLAQEVFGPVLHVVRYQRTALDSLIDAINATGYGLTFGLHTRIDETIEQVVSRVKAGNVYINRNTVGAVVGVQPFGGEGLSGTGPKAGGPLYLARLLSQGPSPKLLVERPSILQGPTGERNTYHHLPRGTVLCIACTPQGAAAQWRAVQATGNMALWIANEVTRSFVTTLGDEHQRRCRITDAPVETLTFNAVLFEGDADALGAFHEQLVARDGPLIPVQGLAPDEAAAYGYAAERLVLERCVTTNTAAAGGNASLMSIG